jgi:hypothetical protein
MSLAAVAESADRVVNVSFFSDLAAARQQVLGELNVANVRQANDEVNQMLLDVYQTLNLADYAPDVRSTDIVDLTAQPDEAWDLRAILYTMVNIAILETAKVESGAFRFRLRS